MSSDDKTRLAGGPSEQQEKLLSAEEAAQKLNPSLDAKKLEVQIIIIEFRFFTGTIDRSATVLCYCSDHRR